MKTKPTAKRRISMHASTKREPLLFKLTMIGAIVIFPIVVALVAVWWIYDQAFGFGSRPAAMPLCLYVRAVEMIEICPTDVEAYL